MHTYEQMCEFMHNSRGNAVDRKKFANNTYIERDGESFAVRLHKTVIVRRTPTYTHLDTGGWLTVTTKDRMNRFLAREAQIISERGFWYISAPGIAYLDGMRLHSRGSSMGLREYPEDAGNRVRNDQTVDQLLRRWRKSTELNAVSCTLCLPVRDINLDAQFPGQSVGDVMGDPQHLLQHLLDRQTSYSLFDNALKAAGYAQPSIWLSGHPEKMPSLVIRAAVNYIGDRLYQGNHARKPVGVTP